MKHAGQPTIQFRILGILAVFSLIAALFACGQSSLGGRPAEPRASRTQAWQGTSGPTQSMEMSTQSAYAAPSTPTAGPIAPEPIRGEREFNTEQYDQTPETGFRLASEQPLSTFSVDVDTASYSNVRRFLGQRQRPPIDAVRIEELVNYFSYDAPRHEGSAPIAIASELSASPFTRGRALLRVGLHAAAPAASEAPAKRLVFLIDVSGSMQDPDKLPLLKSALSLLVDRLDQRDRIAIVVYAGNSGVVLEPTSGSEREQIKRAIGALEAGGSTNGASGITLAYQLAGEICERGANCRVVLATDGDFNVGVTDRGSLVRLIQHERDRGVFLTVLGFGMGNLKDATMEELADKGDGSYAYIDTLREAQKVLVAEASSTLRTVAKDTKIQIEWNPARVARYRLLGYENRRLNDEDFNDDKKDAGEMGDGQSVTALYELELRDGGAVPAARIDPLKYQAARAESSAAKSDELATIKVRWKQPEGGQSQLASAVVRGSARAFAEASTDTRFAAAVAGFGMLLRGSEHAGAISFADVESIASGALGSDRDGYRHEFLGLVAQARGLRD